MGQLRIIVGDITDDNILNGHDLIINPTNPQMIAGAGVSGAIFKKAGVDKLENYTQRTFDINYFSDNYKQENTMKIGDVRITPGFDMNIDIMFVQGPKQWEHSDSLDLLISTYEKMLEQIYINGYKKTLLPSIGTGDYGFNHSDVGKIVICIIKKYICNKDINIDLVLYNSSDKVFYI